MEYPDCPNNTPDECVFQHGTTGRTLLGYTPTFNRKGEVTNKDPNITSSSFSCQVCGKLWRTKTQYGETEITLED